MAHADQGKTTRTAGAKAASQKRQREALAAAAKRRAQRLKAAQPTSPTAAPRAPVVPRITATAPPTAPPPTGTTQVNQLVSPFTGRRPSATGPPAPITNAGIRPLSGGPAFDLAPGTVQSLGNIANNIGTPVTGGRGADPRLFGINRQGPQFTIADFLGRVTSGLVPSSITSGQSQIGTTGRLDFLSPGAAQAMRAQGISPSAFIPDFASIGELPLTGEQPIPLGARQALVALRGGQVLEPWIETLIALGFIEEVGEGDFQLTDAGLELTDADLIPFGGAFGGDGGNPRPGFPPRTVTQFPGGRTPGARAISLGLTNWRI